MLDLIQEKRRQIKFAKEVISAVPNSYPVKDINKVLKLVKFMTIDTLIFADTANDPDTPTSEQRRQARKTMMEHASKTISKNKKEVNNTKKLSDEMKHSISESTIISVDVYRALSAPTNEERRAIYNSHWNERIYNATHNNLVFQGVLEDDKGPEIIAVDYYDNVINNDANYKKFVNAKDITEKRKILFDNIDIVSINILDMQESEYGASCGIKGTIIHEPLPKRVYELAEEKI